MKWVDAKDCNGEKYVEITTEPFMMCEKPLIWFAPVVRKPEEIHHVYIDEAILLSDKIVMMTAHPGQVYKEIEVPFDRPRNRAQLVQTKEYNKFRNRLLAMFYSDIVNKIGGEEVVL